MSLIETGSGRPIHYTDSGSGAPLVLIPGHAGDRRGCLTWLADDLEPQFRVIAMDNRDAGENDSETDYYDLADLAHDVVELLDALEIRQAHVIGHSMGGKITLQVALDSPERVNRIVLIGSSLTGGAAHRAGEPIPEPEDWWTDDPIERMRQLIPIIVGPANQETLDETAVSRIAGLEHDNRVTWAGAMRQQAAARPHDLTNALQRVQAPALVIHGNADAVVPFACAEALARGIPNARLLTLEGVGHLPWVERPDLVAPAIIDFLLERNGAAGQESPRPIS